MTSPKQVSDFYDVYTHVLLSSWDVNFHYGYWLSDDEPVAVAVRRMTDVLIDLLALRPGERMLDVGCGIGEPALRLASQVDADITGVSINLGQVLEANRRAEAAGVGARIRFEEADALELPYRDGNFDAAWAFESLLHMNRDRALREIRRVLRPGGRLVIADLLQRAPLSPDHREAFDDALTKFALSALPTVDDYRAFIGEAGLVLDQVIDVSEHTRPTMRHLAASIRARQTELVEQHGEAARQLIDVLLHPVADLPEYGYILINAHRP